MPAKGPFLTPKKPMPIGRGRGRGKGPVTPGPVKPKPKGGKNPQLPYRSNDRGFAPKGKPAPGGKRTDPGFGPKRPQPVKPKPRKLPKGGSIRDLLYRAKPGEVKKQRVEQIRKSKQEQMIQSGQISIMKRPKLNNEKNKLQDMLKGYRSAPDNSKVTYKTRVKPKGPQSMMAAPYRVEKRTVKTSRGR